MQSVIMNMLYWNLLMNVSDITTTVSYKSNNNNTTLRQMVDFSNPDINTKTDGLTFNSSTSNTPSLFISTSQEVVPLLKDSNSKILNLTLGNDFLLRNPIASEDAREDVCYPIYGEEECFPLGGPWSTNRSRPIVEIPSPPEHINTTFHMFSRNDNSSKILQPENIGINGLNKAIFGISGRNVKIIAHGFRSSASVPWVKSMVDELLRAEDDIVIAVNWHLGAMVSYAKASANTRIVGVQTAHLIYKLMTYHQIPLTSFHLVGHSLGSHLMGHCGHYLKSVHNLVIPRITALDPAGPFYKHTHPSTRLDPSDAGFVDVIHTDNDSLLGFPLTIGMIAPIGHLDYYPNGGSGQPLCSYGSVGCQHLRAVMLFTESIRQSCRFMSVVCESYEQFLKGNCWGCEDGYTCSEMGMKAVPLPGRPAMTKLFLNTYGNSPFCGTHYRITVQIQNESATVGHEGEFAVIGIELNGIKETTGEILLSEKSIFYTAETKHKKVVLTNRVGSLKSIVVSFHYPGSIFNPMSWRIKSPVLHLRSITVEELYPVRRWNFCLKEPHLTPYLKYTLTSEQWC